MDSLDIRPILGRKACIALGIVECVENDMINKPDTGSAEVFSRQDISKLVLTKADILRHFPEVFTEEVGQLSGEYNIKVNGTALPVQHPPRRVLVALHNKLKTEF